MDFELTETQMMIRDTARKFADQSLRPFARERDDKGEFPLDVLKEMADLGLMGVNVPTKYGGVEAGVISYSLAMSEISAGDAAIAVTMGVNNMVAEVIATFGTDDQAQTHVTKIVSGEYPAGCFCLSESGAGSDPQAMKTRAKKVDDGWSITGSKAWITSGIHAGIYLVWAQTKVGEKDRISVFLMDPKSDGVVAGKPEKKMGQHASETVSISFDNVFVTDDALLGEVGQGFAIAMMALDGGRVGIASQSLGLAEEALRLSVVYTDERQQFGRKISSFQATQFKLASMATEIEAARALTHRAAWMKEKGDGKFSKEASMAKVYASELACRACDEAVQMHGGYGYTREYLPEKLMRDARVTRIYEGTSEIQRIVIARELLRNQRN